MLRILSLVLVCFCTGAASAPAATREDSSAERLVLYVDADIPAVQRSITRFKAALERRGIARRHRITVRHVGINVFNRVEAGERLAAALRDNPAVVIATSSESAAIARDLTTQIPVIFGSHQDPVRVGLVRSWAAPGANLTGFTWFAPIDMKRLEFLRELTPRARRLGIVIDHWWMQETDGKGILRAAKSDLGFEGRTFLIERPEQLRELQSAAAHEIDAWYVPPTTLPFEHPERLMRALAALRKPVVYPTKRFAESGGLISYQPTQSLDDALDLFAKLTGLILDGVPPSSIPVERPKSFELVVNADEARRLGIALPDDILKRADRIVRSPPNPAQ
jgi:putative tryptophan/tyrosine transport system substrate-binding protein